MYGKKAGSRCKTGTEKGAHTMSPRTLFEQELSQLRNELKAMCFHVEAVYDKLFAAAGERDEDTIVGILEQDNATREMEKRIESECLSLITRQHPLARDLRIVSASLKVVTDIQRVGVHVTDMAELILRLQMQPLADYSAHLPGMAEETRNLLHSAIEAFLHRNMEAAQKVIDGDDRVDDLFNRVKENLVEKLRNEAADVDDCIDVLMLAKYLEKIGDHAVNVGEWEIFQETGNMRNVRLL